MRRITLALVYVFLAAFVLQSCASAEKLVETGNYDRVIEMAQRRLSGKDRKNPKIVAAAEEAFAKVTARDLREIDRLKLTGRDDVWGKINGIYRNMRERQEAISPLLPLTDKHGYTAHFDFVDVRRGEQESREKAARFHYAEAEQLLNRARRGDKEAARIAHRELEETNRYFRNYRNTATLLQEAHDLGTIHILVAVENEAPVVTPQAFEQRLQQINIQNLNRFWQQYHTQAAQRYDYDYRMRLRIQNILVSPDVVREREYVDRKTIEDGWEYVLDARGNVAKDSLGNDIKVPREVTIEAWVLETLQQKEATVEALLEVYDLRASRVIRSQPLAATTLFENYASTFTGDRRALSNDTRRRIGNAPIPFPTGPAMILQAADELKPAFFDRIEDYHAIVGL